MVIGKLVGGLLGLLAGGFLGLVIGVLIGHAFDRGLKKTFSFASPENLARIRESFFDTTFALAGHLAKADGRISEGEIAHMEQLFRQLGLGSEQRQRAIERFKEGAAPDFQPERAAADFLATCGPQRQLQHTLLLFLISLAHAEGEMTPAEYAVLARVAGAMGVGALQLDRLLNMVRAQSHFHGQASGSSGAPPRNSVDDAYRALGVEADVSDRDLKRAYRKLMSENHPDKLIARGVPEDMVKLATERSQEIQAAYEVLRKHRGLRR